MITRAGTAIAAALILIARLAAAQLEPVTVHNFTRAESDFYFGRTVEKGGFGKFEHAREMTPLDKQSVVRMNRDTLYSSAVFDLDAAPVTITLPDPGKRFMSMQATSEDHYAIEVVYAPGKYVYTKDRVGTRYVFVAVRTLADPRSPEDMKAAHALQDAIRVEQAATGTFEVPRWDPASQAKVRDALAVLGGTRTSTAKTFGRKEDVNPIDHLIGTAIGWGGNPPEAASYLSLIPQQNDGTTPHTLTLKDVPVDGFWSVSVYDAKGFFQKNDLDAYSVNSVTAKPNPDGSFTIRFGECKPDTPNCLPIMAGWNYTIRLYKPRKEVLEGSWKIPSAQPSK